MLVYAIVRKVTDVLTIALHETEPGADRKGVGTFHTVPACNVITAPGTGAIPQSTDSGTASQDEGPLIGLGV